ncbi:transporter substrate-binding domain-containing protein [Pseudomonas alkylphenolica]|uniref:transporter substrate-binding domain-containing protein n=1 Tax=Pseudomonas alkylphenolica TaxID=237609 RepID=UPI0018D6E5CB|nr:transporter substrate-binding domain-containing protein [Pseudomonas alkylphenolica]MBH3429137.1 transporter substrate-binding domain-containing protein [Pseudomonas alkylphenolica]
MKAMTSFTGVRLCLAVLLLLFASVSFSHGQSLTLLGRSEIAVTEDRLHLSLGDWEWLKAKQVLRLGASGPDYPPFDISVSGEEYEGLTADFAQLLSKLLHVPIEVRRYESRKQVIAALKAGEIDLLGTANRFEAADAELVLSNAYAEDQPTIVARADMVDALDPDLAHQRVAMLNHYLPAETVRDFYPQAQVQLYSSSLAAMGAVAFGKADVFLGDSVSANYLIGNRYMDTLQLADLANLPASHFSFALAKENLRLLALVNTALESIPLNERKRILRRWNASDSSTVVNRHIHFSEAERQWVARHPRLRVAFSDNALPIAFIDDNGKLGGISADILAKISQRTGLKFDVLRADSSETLVNLVRTGQVDALAAYTPTPHSKSGLSFTRPYFISPFVMVAGIGSDRPSSLEDLAGKQLAMIPSSPLYQYIMRNYPNVRLIETSTFVDAMALVAQGKADAMVTSLISARYVIGRHYQDSLKITSTVDMPPAQVSLATAPNAAELQSILNKALLSITPQEMEKLTNRWRGDVLVEDSFWRTHKGNILRGLALAVVLLVLATIWITYLRRLIHKRQEAERALGNQLAFMQVMVDGTPHPIYVRDREGRLLNCNAAYAEILGLDKPNILGRDIAAVSIVDPNDLQAYEAEYQAVIGSGIAKVQDRAVATVDGRQMTIYHWMLPFRDCDGRVDGIIGGWIDISERQCLLQALEEAKNEADNASNAKSTFLATMSHEIRTPMNAVIGMLELANKKAEQGVFDRLAIEVASDAAKGLLELIGDILDISRIESGKLSLAPERVSLCELFESLTRLFEGLARQKGLKLTLQLDPRANRVVHADPVRLKQIISNLLGNAIKFTDEGSVDLSVCIVPSGDERVLALNIAIADTGCGISEQDQQLLFNPFAQGSNHAHTVRQGTGLGLFISRTLCEMMNGELRLSSTVGIGTEVMVALDLPLLGEVSIVDRVVVEAPAAHHSLNILVVDDHSTNRLLLSQQLDYLGHRTVLAEDGAVGFKAWLAQSFDVVITDCNMPSMNGYALANAIRAHEKEHGNRPCHLIGLTANAQPEERQRCMGAGMDDCLFKPIGLQQLEAGLKGEFHSQSRADYAPAEPTAFNMCQVLSVLNDLTGGNEAAVETLLGDLDNSNRRDCESLERLSHCKDLNGLVQLAHKIKGGARVIRHHAVIEACEGVELLCASGQSDSSELVRTCDQLTYLLTKLSEELQECITNFDKV